MNGRFSAGSGVAAHAAAMFTYDFGYSWWLNWGHALVAASAGILAFIAWRRRGVRASALVLAAIALWGAAGAVAMRYAVQIGSPQRLATPSFLSAGHGEVLELGAGSGRATIGLLQARPGVTLIALDAYRGYYGIDANTPERLQRNLRAAGLENRVTVKVADMRTLPFENDRFEAAYSVAAIDHLPWDGIAQTLAETARVLRPGGQLLIVSLNNDAWIRLAMPWSLHGHGFWGSRQSQRRWREAIEAAGLSPRENGHRPAMAYLLATKPEATTRSEGAP